MGVCTVGEREDGVHCYNWGWGFSLCGALTSAIILLVSPRNSQLRAEAAGGKGQFNKGEHL